MFCRECCMEINDKAEICVHCGVRPLNSDRFCQACGAETRPGQEVCIICGNRLKRLSDTDESLGLVKAVSCCFPLIGAVLYLVWKTDKPKNADTACKWALIGLLVEAGLYLFSFCLGVLSM